MATKQLSTIEYLNTNYEPGMRVCGWPAHGAECRPVRTEEYIPMGGRAVWIIDPMNRAVCYWDGPTRHPGCLKSPPKTRCLNHIK